jgi:8-oxo-dGTP diphosphatase
MTATVSTVKPASGEVLRALLTPERVQAIVTAGARPPTVSPGAAGVLYVDDTGRVLLVHPSYKPYWDLPGGIIEPGESPRDAARRELHEKLGCQALPVGDLLVVDFLPAKDGRPASMRYVFGCLWNSPSGAVPFDIQPGEIDAWAWSTPEQQTERQLEAPILARRVAAARAALYGKQTVYLENGFEVRP